MSRENTQYINENGHYLEHLTKQQWQYKNKQVHATPHINLIETTNDHIKQLNKQLLQKTNSCKQRKQ